MNCISAGRFLEVGSLSQFGVSTGWRSSLGHAPSPYILLNVALIMWFPASSSCWRCPDPVDWTGIYPNTLCNNWCQMNYIKISLYVDDSVDCGKLSLFQIKQSNLDVDFFRQDRNHTLGGPQQLRKDPYPLDAVNGLHELPLQWWRHLKEPAGRKEHNIDSKRTEQVCKNFNRSLINTDSLVDNVNMCVCFCDFQVCRLNNCSSWIRLTCSPEFSRWLLMKKQSRGDWWLKNVVVPALVLLVPVAYMLGAWIGARSCENRLLTNDCYWQSAPTFYKVLDLSSQCNSHRKMTGQPNQLISRAKFEQSKHWPNFGSLITATDCTWEYAVVIHEQICSWFTLTWWITEMVVFSYVLASCFFWLLVSCVHTTHPMKSLVLKEQPHCACKVHNDSRDCLIIGSTLNMESLFLDIWCPTWKSGICVSISTHGLDRFSRYLPQTSAGSSNWCPCEHIKHIQSLMDLCEG